MAFKSIKDFPESTSPSGEWFALCDDGTGCYYKVKLKNLPGGGFTTTSSTTTAAGTTSTTTTMLTTSTTTTAVPASTTTSTTSSTSTSSTTTSSTSSTTSTTTTIVYDPDAQAFFTAAGITNVTQKGAVNGLVQALKGYSLWTKMKAIYPFVGGTATTHKFNLKNPADTDGAFRIVFNGGVTHSANGVQFDGSTGYGDTKFSISDFASTTNLSYGVYIRTQGTANAFDMGVYDFVGLVSAYNFIWSGSRRFYYNSNSATPQFLTWSSSGPYGFIAGSINGTAGTVYRNGALGQSGTTPNDAIPAPGIYWYIGNVNDGSNAPEPSSWSNNQYAFAYLGDSLTTLEMTSLYTAVQNYQIALSRQV